MGVIDWPFIEPFNPSLVTLAGDSGEGRAIVQWYSSEYALSFRKKRYNPMTCQFDFKDDQE